VIDDGANNDSYKNIINHKNNRISMEFKYLGTTLTNQNSIQEEIKSRLKSRNV